MCRHLSAKCDEDIPDSIDTYWHVESSTQVQLWKKLFQNSGKSGRSRVQTRYKKRIPFSSLDRRIINGVIHSFCLRLARLKIV